MLIQRDIGNHQYFGLLKIFTVSIFFQSNGPPPGYFHKYTFKRMTKNTENGPIKFVFLFFSSRL